MGVTERHQHVVPLGVRGLRHIGGRWVGIGVGVGVEHPDDGHPFGLGVPVGPEVLHRVDRVELGRGGDVPGRIAAQNLSRGQVTTQQTASLVREPAQAVADHLRVQSRREPQHGR